MSTQVNQSKFWSNQDNSSQNHNHSWPMASTALCGTIGGRSRQRMVREDGWLLGAPDGGEAAVGHRRSKLGGAIYSVGGKKTEVGVCERVLIRDED